MATRTLELTILPEIFAVCRLEPDDALPQWAFDGSFYSVTRTRNELSIICPESNVPESALQDGSWRCLSVEGQLDFWQIGVFASLAGPLADAGVSIFPIATYDTDHVLVKDDDLGRALDVLESAGHHIRM